MPAGGEAILGDGGAFAGLDPNVEWRQAILAKARELEADDEHAATAFVYVVNAAVEVGVAREAETLQTWTDALAKAQAETERVKAERDAFMNAGKALTREYAYLKAKAGTFTARIDAVREVCDAGERQAARWEQPFPVPAWVTDVRAALEGATEGDQRG